MMMEKARLVVFLIFLSAALAAQQDDDSLIAAANAVASDKASEGASLEKQKALAFVNNTRINQLAMENRIDKETYQKAQAEFERKNRELCEKAADKHGLSVSGAVKGGGFKPGTDTDLQLEGKGRKLTADDVKKTRAEYSRQCAEYARENGIKVDGSENFAKRNKTDIMPSPSQMKSEDEFKKSAAVINGDGGNMYKRPEAAKVQMSIDGDKPVMVAESGAYVREMEEKVDSMKKARAEYEKEMKTAKDPQAKAVAEGELRLCASHEAKYIGRINQLESQVRKTYGMEPAKAADPTLADATRRDSDKAAKRAEAKTDATSRFQTEKAIKNLNNTIAEIGRDPASREASQKAIADNLKNMRPAQKADALNEIEARHGAEYAKGVVREMKRPSSPAKTAPSAGSNASIAKKLGTAGFLLDTGLRINEELKKKDPNYGKVAADTALSLSPLGKYVNSAKAALYEATEGTRLYRKELEEEYARSGENLSDFSTQLKIWARATAHGSMMGAYQLAHAVPLLGDTISAAETAWTLYKETVSTIDELETQRALVREQKMTQKVVAAKSVLSARKLLAEMRALSAAAAEQRARLTQACLAASDLSMEHESWKNQVADDTRALAALDALGDKPAAPAPSPSEAGPRLEKAFAAVRAAAENCSAQADKIGKSLNKDGSLPDSQIAAAQALADSHNANLQAHAAAVAEMQSLAGAAAGGGSERQKIEARLLKSRESLLRLSSSLGGTSASVKSMSESHAQAVKRYYEAKAALAKGYDFFWKNNAEGSAEWERIRADSTAIKDPPKDPPPSAAKAASALDRLAADMKSEAAAINIAEAKTTAASASDEKEASAILARLKKPADAAAKAVEEAAARMAPIIALLLDSKNRLEIRVADSETSAPVAGAVVKISGGKDGAQARTNADGLAVAAKIGPGKYTVSVTAPGYEPSEGVSINISEEEQGPFSQSVPLSKPGAKKKLPKRKISTDRLANMSWKEFLRENVPLFETKAGEKMYGYTSAPRAGSTQRMKILEEGVTKDEWTHKDKKYKVWLDAESRNQTLDRFTENKEKTLREWAKEAQTWETNWNVATPIKNCSLLFTRHKMYGYTCASVLMYPCKIGFTIYPHYEGFNTKESDKRRPGWEKAASDDAEKIASTIAEKLSAWMNARIGTGPGIKGHIYPHPLKDYQPNPEDFPRLKLKTSSSHHYEFTDPEQPAKDRLRDDEYTVWFRINDQLDTHNLATAEEPFKKASECLQKEIKSFTSTVSQGEDQTQVMKMNIEGADEAYRHIRSSPNFIYEVVFARKCELVIVVAGSSVRKHTGLKKLKLEPLPHTARIVGKIIEKIDSLPQYCE